MKTCRLGGLFLLLFCVHTIMYAQQARTVRGKVQMQETGSEKKQALPSASIVVLEKADSTSVKGTASDKNGRFTLTYQAQDKKEYLLKVSSLRLNSGGRYSNRVSMVNEDRNVQPEKSTTRDTGLDCEVKTGYQPAWGGLELAAFWNYQYSLNSLNDNDNYTRYYNFRFDGYVDFPFGLQLRTDAAYMLRSGTNIQKGEDDEIVWNATATWRFLKEKKAELSAHWVDILGRRKSFNRMPTADGFYEFRTQEIKGYFIVTFKYNFRLMM